MSKACLVMDMPESCMGCNFLYCDAENNTESCQARENARIVDLEKEAKPDWCPLRPMPEKDNRIDTCINKQYGRGWNACIDATGGGDGE